MKRIMAFCAALLITTAAHAAGPTNAGANSVRLSVGQARQLSAGDTPPGTRWTSSQESIVEVLDNGYVIALAPGTAQIRAGNREWTVTSTPPIETLRDVASIEQHTDDRKF